MLDRLEAIKARFDQLGVALTNPEIVGNNKKFAETSKEYRSLEKIVNAYNDYKKLLDDIDFYKEALNGDDEELRDVAPDRVRLADRSGRGDDVEGPHEPMPVGASLECRQRNAADYPQTPEMALGHLSFLHRPDVRHRTYRGAADTLRSVRRYA